MILRTFAPTFLIIKHSVFMFKAVSFDRIMMSWPETGPEDGVLAEIMTVFCSLLCLHRVVWPGAGVGSGARGSEARSIYPTIMQESFA